MNDRQVQCFLAVADTLSFSAAARALFVTQPAVTHQIRMLEAELGAQLFVRNTVRTSLTEAGRAFYPNAQAFFRLYQDTLRKLDAFSQHNTLVVAFPQVVLLRSDSSYSRVARRFREAYPEAALKTPKLSKHAGIYGMLQNKSADALIEVLDREALDKSPYFYEKLWDIEFLACVGPKSPLAGKKSISPEDLRGQTVYCLPEEPPSPWHRGEPGSGIRVGMEILDSLNVIANYLSGGQGLYFTPYPISEDGGLQYIPLDPPSLCEMGVVWRKLQGERRLNLERFLQILREECAEGL